MDNLQQAAQVPQGESTVASLQAEVTRLREALAGLLTAAKLAIMESADVTSGTTLTEEAHVALNEAICAVGGWTYEEERKLERLQGGEDDEEEDVEYRSVGEIDRDLMIQEENNRSLDTEADGRDAQSPTTTGGAAA